MWRAGFFLVFAVALVASTPYVPGTPGAPWTDAEALIVKGKLYSVFSRYGGGNALKELYPDWEGPWIGKWQRLPSAPKALRLGFHDCLKYTDGTGGCDGCLNWSGVFYVQPELTDTYSGPNAHSTDNNGLGYMVEVLEEIYTNPSYPSRTVALNESLRDSGKSRADLWAFAAITAAEYGIETNNRVCDDPDNIYNNRQCHHEQGQPDCKIELERSFQFQTGRADCVTNEAKPYMAAKEESHPNPVGSGYDTADFFQKDFGLTGREMVALLGAHTFGRFHYGVSLFRYVWTSRGTELFNNHYYKNIVRKPEMFYNDNACTANTDAWGNTPPTRWVVHVRGDTQNGGPAHWIHENYVCPNCVANPDDVCCQGVDTSVNYCLPDGPTNGTDDNGINGGCERYRFISGIDEMALSSEIGLYFDFNVTNGLPHGCPGFEDFTTEKFKQGYKYKWTRVDNQKADPECGYQNLQIPSGSTPTAMVFREYADDQDLWIRDFIPVLEKMLANGYKEGDLVDGPDQWTDVTCPPQNPWDNGRFYNCYTTGPDASYFQIISKLNNQAVQQDLNNPNFRAVMWENTGSDLQLWTWSLVGDQLINKQTNMPLKAGGGIRWRVETDASGSRLVDIATGRSMDRSWNQSNGAVVGTWESHNGPNQMFEIKPAS